MPWDAVSFFVGKLERKPQGWIQKYNNSLFNILKISSLLETIIILYWKYISKHLFEDKSRGIDEDILEK